MREMKVACYGTVVVLNPDQVEMVGGSVAIREAHFGVHNLPAPTGDNWSTNRHYEVNRVILCASVTSRFGNLESLPYFVGQNISRCLWAGKTLQSEGSGSEEPQELETARMANRSGILQIVIECTLLSTRVITGIRPSVSDRCHCKDCLRSGTEDF